MGEFDGVWTGSTAQGQPASFTISNRTITAITVPYDFNGCSGVKSFSNLSVGISQSSGLMPVQVNYTSGPFGGPDQTSVFFVIYPDAAAINVTASFFNYSGCGNATTFFTAFKGSPPNYSGHWSGSTSQGAPIAFVVASLKIQSITLGFNFGACAGTTTYPDLALPIAAVGSRVGFSYTSGPPELPNHALIIGYFDSSTAADGVVVFTGYPGCANQTATWTATAVPSAIGAGSTQLPTKRGPDDGAASYTRHRSANGAYRVKQLRRPRSYQRRTVSRGAL